MDDKAVWVFKQSHSFKFIQNFNSSTWEGGSLWAIIFQEFPYLHLNCWKLFICSLWIVHNGWLCVLKNCEHNSFKTLCNNLWLDAVYISLNEVLWYVSDVTGWMAISVAIAVLLYLKRSAVAFLGDITVNRAGGDSNMALDW